MLLFRRFFTMYAERIVITLKFETLPRAAFAAEPGCSLQS